MNGFPADSMMETSFKFHDSFRSLWIRVIDFTYLLVLSLSLHCSEFMKIANKFIKSLGNCWIVNKLSVSMANAVMCTKTIRKRLQTTIPEYIIDFSHTNSTKPEICMPQFWIICLVQPKFEAVCFQLFQFVSSQKAQKIKFHSINNAVEKAVSF